jgi:hypothetical protein
MYGPFWTLTTLIFTLFLSSSLAASITTYLSVEGKGYDYDFTLLSFAVSIVYAYGLALPLLLWIALRYIGVGGWSIVEAMAIWGYAQFVWIPVSVRTRHTYINFPALNYLTDTLRHPRTYRSLGTRRPSHRVLGLVPRSQHLPSPSLRTSRHFPPPSDPLIYLSLFNRPKQKQPV